MPPGRDEKVYIDLVTEQGENIGQIHYRLKNKDYVIKPCTLDWPNMLPMSNVPTDREKTWKITKSSISITITCNDVEVVNLVFDSVEKKQFPECVNKLAQKVMKITFTIHDTATDLYLAPPKGNISYFFSRMLYNRK